MKKRLFPIIFVVATTGPLTQLSVSAQHRFTVRTVASELHLPWEIEFGPDGSLWTTERNGVISRIDVETGSKTVLLDKRKDVFEKNESGMLGLCLHPNFADTPWVFVAYVAGPQEALYRVVERYRYEQDTLLDPVEVIRLQPADLYHQGCRLLVDGSNKLLITMGDAPNPSESPEDSSLCGKVLRLNLDGTIPADNPIPGNPLWSKGHRNVQGLAQLPTGQLWTSEHGNIVEDEVNRIVPGGNYGWPWVEGACDEQHEREYCDSAGVIEPMWSSGSITFAPSGMAYYGHNRYPELTNSLLVAFLKSSMLMQLKLDESGNTVIGSTPYLQYAIGRLRDVAVSADGRIFLCTSNHWNGYYPFPQPEDDRIVELIPVPDSSTSHLIVPDTVFIQARPDYPRVFGIPIQNTGTAPAHIKTVWNLQESQHLFSAQWRTPLVVLPGQTYQAAAEFIPYHDAHYQQTVQVIEADDTFHNITVIGTTDVGVADAIQDSIRVGVVYNRDTLIRVGFVNIGTDSVTVLDAFISNECEGVYEVVGVQKGVLWPSDTAWATVRFTPTEDGVFSCPVELRTTGYYIPKAVVSASYTVVGVGETDAIKPMINVYPNPFTGHAYVEVRRPTNEGVITVSDIMGTVLFTSRITPQMWDPSATSETVVSLWNGRTSDGMPVGRGTYVVQYRSEFGVTSRILIKQYQ